jgi:hypothetical protein
MRLQPQASGSDGRINASIFPPCGFVATAMGLAMMAPTQRHGELIADLAAERAVLREAQVMGVCGPAAANQTRLFAHEPDVLLVSVSARLGMGQPALVDAVGSGCLGGPDWLWLGRCGPWQRGWDGSLMSAALWSAASLA